MRKITCLIPKGNKKPYFITKDAKDIVEEFNKNPLSHWAKKFICDIQRDGKALRTAGGADKWLYKQAVMFIYEDEIFYAYRWTSSVGEPIFPEEKDFVEAYREELHYRLLLKDCLKTVEDYREQDTVLDPDEERRQCGGY